jgi:predicted phage terminase large subunit-like protein
MREQFDQRLLAAAPKSLSHFVEYMTPDEPPARHHDWMCRHMEGVEAREIMRSMISMPPGHAKSKFCSKYFPAWYLGKHFNHKFIQGGHSQDFAEKEFGAVVRTIIRDERYRNVFPEVRVSNESSAAGYWRILGKNGSYLAKGVGQGIAGFRGNIACVDDPFAKAEDAESAVIREKVFNWFTWDFTTRLLPNSPVFIVSTRWHSDDLCGRLEKMTKNGEGIPWEIINLPALSDSDDDILGRKYNEPLWPEYYTFDFLNDLRAVLPAKAWNSLYMGKPSDSIGGVVNSDMFSRYDELPKNVLSEDKRLIKQLIKRVTLSVDTASKTNERNDFTVITVWIESTEGNHYLAEVIRKRLEFDDMCKEIDNCARKWNVNEILIEDKGSGTQYIQTRRGRSLFPITPIIPKGEKEFRFDGVIPMFTTGMVILPKKSAWLADYEAELIAFPNGKFDDQVDATSQYLEYKRKGLTLGTRKLKGTK